MKSIMEQASSIIKAIEKAWISADSPKEFSVKIFEKEEKNFFGMTTKPAKIGIFFNDSTHPSSDKHSSKEVDKKSAHQAVKPTAKQVRSPEQQTAKPASHPHNQTQKRENPAQKQTSVRPTAKTEQRTEKSHKKTSAPSSDAMPSSTVWTPMLQDVAQSWVTKSLNLTNRDDISFVSEVMGKNLTLTFNKPLIQNPLQEKQLFRSIAHLVIASLRNQYKNEIKDLKIVLIRPE